MIILTVLYHPLMPEDYSVERKITEESKINCVSNQKATQPKDGKICWNLSGFGFILICFCYYKWKWAKWRVEEEGENLEPFFNCSVSQLGLCRWCFKWNLLRCWRMFISRRSSIRNLCVRIWSVLHMWVYQVIHPKYIFHFNLICSSETLWRYFVGELHLFSIKWKWSRSMPIEDLSMQW